MKNEILEFLNRHNGGKTAEIAEALAVTDYQARYYLLLLEKVNRPGFPGECFICELRLPDHCFRWRHNKLFLFLSEEYGPAFSVIVDCYTSPPTLVWPVSLLSGFSSSYGVLPPFCKDH